MDAVVLVGGFGTRLRPLTLTQPKQMLPIVDRPMISHVVAWLGAQGVTRAVLALGYKPDVFVAAFPEGRIGDVELVYAVEDEPLDTAGAIRFAADTAGVDSTFLAVNGDVLTDLDLAALLALHRDRAALATLHLIEVDDPSRYGVVPLDERNRVLEFVEKPPRETAPSRWINAGTYVLEPEVLDHIPSGRKVSIERETFPALAAAGDLYALQAPVYWIDTGTPATYLESQLDLVRGRRRLAVDAVAATATIAPDAALHEAVVMAGASVGAGALIERSVVGPGAVVEAGAVVRDSVVGPGASVGAGAVIEALSVLGHGAQVAPGEVLNAELRPPPPY
jgi:mannose-1-phosphate guanylyltransferase